MTKKIDFEWRQIVIFPSLTTLAEDVHHYNFCDHWIIAFILKSFYQISLIRWKNYPWTQHQWPQHELGVRVQTCPKSAQFALEQFWARIWKPQMKTKLSKSKQKLAQKTPKQYIWWNFGRFLPHWILDCQILNLHLHCHLKIRNTFKKSLTWVGKIPLFLLEPYCVYKIDAAIWQFL